MIDLIRSVFVRVFTMTVSSLQQLRNLVMRKLGQCENLLADQFPLTESRLFQGGRECGLQFVLHGPRSVRLTAIWVQDKNDLYLYNARGERFEKMSVRLVAE